MDEKRKNKRSGYKKDEENKSLWFREKNVGEYENKSFTLKQKKFRSKQS